MMYGYFADQLRQACEIYAKWLDLWCVAAPTAPAEKEESKVSTRPAAYRTPPKTVRAFAAPRPMARGR